MRAASTELRAEEQLEEEGRAESLSLVRGMSARWKRRLAIFLSLRVTAAPHNNRIRADNLPALTT